jgi:hypothetical protein
VSRVACDTRARRRGAVFDCQRCRGNNIGVDRRQFGSDLGWEHRRGECSESRKQRHMANDSTQPYLNVGTRDVSCADADDDAPAKPTTLHTCVYVLPHAAAYWKRSFPMTRRRRSRTLPRSSRSSSLVPAWMMSLLPARIVSTIQRVRVRAFSPAPRDAGCRPRPRARRFGDAGTVVCRRRDRLGNVTTLMESL